MVVKRGFAIATLPLGGASAVLWACVLADPPAELPTVSNRPAILHQLVVPPTTRVLNEWPDGHPLEIPVVIDPGATFVMSPFVDYDPVTNPSPYGNSTQFTNVSLDGGTYLMRVSLVKPDVTLCHTIEVVIALGFDGDLRTPNRAGGDSVSWIFSPTGSLATCQFYPLAGADASEAGDDAASASGADAFIGVTDAGFGATPDAAPDATVDAGAGGP